MKTNQRKPPMYFNTENFIAALLKDLKMDKSDPKVVAELSDEIAITLTDRVTSVIIDSMGEKELFLLYKTKEDHPELDEIDCLSIITAYIPGLEGRILKAVDDLYAEILETAGMIDKRLAETK